MRSFGVVKDKSVVFLSQACSGMLICVKVAMFCHPKPSPARPFLPPTHTILNFSLMTPKRSFICQQTGGKGCDLPCRVSSESRLLQTGVKCRPRPLQMIPTEPVRTTAARPGSRLQPAATRRKLVHSGGGFMADQRDRKTRL